MNSLQWDALREIGNIGAGHAAGALADVIKKRIVISTCHVDVKTVHDFLKILQYDDDKVGVAQSVFSGDVNGIAYCLMPIEEILRYSNGISTVQPSSSRNAELDLTVAKGCGISMLKSYLEAVSMFLKLSVIQGMAEFKQMKTDVFLESLPRKHGKNDMVFCVEVFLKEIHENMKFYFLMVFKENNFVTVLKRLEFN